MPSKIGAESERYVSRLKRTAADGKVTGAEADKLIAEAKKDFTEVKGHYLAGFVDGYQSKFDAQAKAKLARFVHGEMPALARVAAEEGQAKPVAQPGFTADDVKAGGVKYAPRAGQLFVGGVGADDPLQGAVGDCYFVSALAALAKAQPRVIEQAIQTNRDGTYTVTFYEKKTADAAPRPVRVTVDGQLPVKNGQLEYMAARDVKELWPEVLEKAYASWKGSYDLIESGMSANAFEALTGKKPGYFFLPADESPQAVFGKLKEALAQGGAVVALSEPFEAGIPGMVADHAYTVLGVTEQGGQHLVQLRNPWGQREPGHDGRDDGVFQMPVAQFLEAFATVEFVTP